MVQQGLLGLVCYACCHHSFDVNIAGLDAQAARNAEPPDMAKAIRKKEAQRESKRKKQRDKETAASKGSAGQPAGADEDKKSKIQIMTFGSGSAKIVNEFEAVVDEEEGLIDDAEDDGAVDPMQVLPAITAITCAPPLPCV